MWNRMKDHIDISQAAYQQGRSTTEQVYTLKTMIEKAITTENYEIFIILLDMSKAFDTVNRPKLLQYLKEILSECEMNMINILIKDIILNVQIGQKIGNDIVTEQGITQGDCLSAIFFVFYLGKAIKPIPLYAIREDYRDKIFWSELDWLVEKDKHFVEITPKCADDISASSEPIQPK